MPILTKCRKLVGTFKHSTTLSEQLANTIGRLNTASAMARPLYDVEDEGVELDLEDLGTPCRSSNRTKLVQDMVTRWNSTLAMLRSISESHSAIRMVITSDADRRKKYQSELLEDYELGVVEDLILLLDPFLEMTKLVSGSLYVTASITLPGVTRILECLQLYQPAEGSFNFIKLSLNSYRSYS